MIESTLSFIINFFGVVNYAALVLFDVFRSIFDGLVHLAKINYEVVSFIFRVFQQFSTILQRLFAGLILAGTDFIDQYGDLCVAVLSSIGSCVYFLFSGLVHITQVIVKTLSILLNGVVLSASSVPYAFWYIKESVDKYWTLVEGFPLFLLDGVITGFGLLGALVYNSANTLIGALLHTMYDFFTTIAGLTSKLITSNRVSSAVLSQTPSEISVEACIGIIIAIVSYFIYKAALPSEVVRRSIRRIRAYNFGVRDTVSSVWHKILGFATFAVRSVVYVPVQQLITFIRWPLVGRHRLPVEPTVDHVLQRPPLNSHRNPPQRSSNMAEPTLHRPRDINTTEYAERYLCVVCQDREKEVLIEHCHHLCMCRECAKMVYAEHRRCPICRRRIWRLVDVYM